MPTINWLNRKGALTLSQQAPYRLLEVVPEYSYGDEGTENMLIQGDNLDALKALLPYYAGKVKCIYIDPPFNTQQAFEHYDDNLEHSIWLTMMYPRLELLGDLLAEEGTIAIHIDDNELAYLITIGDEIFGRRNRTGLVTFKQGSATGHKAINPGMVTITNYIVFYAKDKGCWDPNKIYTARDRDKRYSQYIENIEDHYSCWRTIPLAQAFANYRGKSIKELKTELGNLYEEDLSHFARENANNVIRDARPNYQGVGENVREVIDESKANPDTVYYLPREPHSDMYFKNGERWLFYKDKLKEIDDKLTPGEPLTNLWIDILSNNLHNEGGVSFPKGKKPEGLAKRIIELFTSEGDLVLDSFLGSGTFIAAAHKMNRRYIGIELGEHATALCVPRLRKVVDGEQGGISKALNWQGGGSFRFYRLGEPIFDERGHINRDIRFPTLAAHIWFSETRRPISGKPDSPLLGIHDDIAYYLLFNGILGDKRPDGGNVLTTPILRQLPPHNGLKIIYGEATRFKPRRLKEENITFKHIPYDIKAR